MLDKIIENKRKELEIRKKMFPLASFMSKLEKSDRDFKDALSNNRLTLIAEIKRKSPSGSITNNNLDINKTMEIYNKYANCISVLTDTKFFDGSLGDLKRISESTALPILRKDFIIDEYQIYESRLYNADAILLITSILSKDQIRDFINIASNFDMDCIVEVHNEEELNKILDICSIDIIGINNRNLDTLKIDTNTTLNLANKIPEDKIIISESGISSKEYVKKIEDKVNAILVGSLFMNSNDIEKEIINLIK